MICGSGARSTRTCSRVDGSHTSWRRRSGPPTRGWSSGRGSSPASAHWSGTHIKKVTGSGGTTMPNRERSEREDDLRSTSESLRDDAFRLASIEEDKGKRKIGDPTLSQESREAERLAEGIRRKSRVERDLSEGG